MKAQGLSHVGKIREINEDYSFISLEKIGALPNLFIVADGMGGHKAGEVASALAVEAFTSYVREHLEESQIEGLLKEATIFANQIICKKALSSLDLFGMGTTFVACTILEDFIYIINVGDSRLYTLTDTLDQITIDHSYVEELVRAGEITRDESLHHPAKNKITRALGATNQVDVDIFKLSIRHIKKLLLCSDGLTNMVTDMEIQGILNTSQSVSDQCQELMDLALSHGGTDNISLIIIEAEN